MTPAAFVLMFALAFGGEIIDRIVVTVNRGIVTESDVRRHIRVAAALNGDKPDFGEQSSREAIDRLIDLAIIRREMELARFPEPSDAETKAWAVLVYKERLPGFDTPGGLFPRSGLPEKDLIAELRNQLITLRFIEFRFRPGISVGEDDIASYYQSKFLREWKSAEGEAPPLDDVRERIEKILVDQRIDEALHRWIEDARKQARIVFASEARPQGKSQ